MSIDSSEDLFNFDVLVGDGVSLVIMDGVLVRINWESMEIRRAPTC